MAGENYINHVVLVLDASYSMEGHSSTLIKVTDAQIEYLARRSEELDQETRVSIYDFADDVRCLVYDKDVLRLPSIESIYRTRGSTALIDATIKSLEDLGHSATLYGDHAFLTYVLTDGMENRSRNRPTTLKDRLSRLPSNWTVAALVPNQNGVRMATGFGFPAENVAVWDTSSAKGVVEVGKTIRQATDNFMEARSKGGFTGTRSLFSTGIDAINKQTVEQNLVPLTNGSYQLLSVNKDSRIDEFVKGQTGRYSIGQGFYQLTKREEIQPQKQIAIREKRTGKVYSGAAARDLLGLSSNASVKVKPDQNPEYDVFVQSTSVNRKLIRNTDVLVMR